jgi:sucrose phosphorylase
MSISNKVQLITYADSLGKNLQDLEFVLDNYLKNIVGGVHILPFYPSSVDRGFGPLTHLEVDPKFGSWSDIRKIASKFDLTADLVVNHISDKSIYFQDFLDHGRQSKYADMFLTMDKFFPDGVVDQELMSQVYVRKPVLPIEQVQLKSGEVVGLWNTFFREQIDLDIYSQVTRDLFSEFINNLAKNGVKMLRLDAIGYVTKKLGTKCFFEEPEIYEVLDWVYSLCTKNEIEILPELHLDYQTAQKLTDRGYFSYDFALPVLVLHALFTKDTQYLKHWLKIRSPYQITVLDTHDGIGMIDVKGLLPEEEVLKTKTWINQNGGNDNLFSSASKIQNLDIYQVNCTFYSALDGDDKKYLAARAIQLFTPGIPQVYYVGLLAGKNDFELLQKTNQGRDINRHYYTLDEIKQNLDRPVVQKLFQLLEFRNANPAFDGEFELVETPSDMLEMVWKNGTDTARLRLNLQNYDLVID